MATGLRRAELVGLTWDDIDLRNSSLEVRTTTTVVRGREVSSEGKTDAAQRRLTLDDHLAGVLTKHQGTRVPRSMSAGHVFTDVDGKPLNPQRLTKHFARLADRFDLPKIGVHGLRHTAATLMLNHGVPIHIVANRLGHTDPSTTLSVYAHVMPNDDQIAAAAMSQVLFSPPDQAVRQLRRSGPADLAAKRTSSVLGEPGVTGHETRSNTFNPQPRHRGL